MRFDGRARIREASARCRAPSTYQRYLGRYANGQTEERETAPRARCLDDVGTQRMCPQARQRFPGSGTWAPHLKHTHVLGAGLPLKPMAPSAAIQRSHAPPAHNKIVPSMILPSGLWPLLLGWPAGIAGRFQELVDNHSNKFIAYLRMPGADVVHDANQVQDPALVVVWYLPKECCT